MNILRFPKSKYMSYEFPANLFKVDTPLRSQLYFNFSKTLKFQSFLRRERLQAKFLSKCSSYPRIEDGYLIYPYEKSRGNFNSMDKAIESCQAFLEGVNLDSSLSKDGKDFLRIIPIAEKLSLQHPIVQLALDPLLLSIIANYLGVLPILRDIRIYYSPTNRKLESIKSQAFHLDHDDFRQVKAFIPIFDVTEDCGPFTFLPASTSRTIYGRLKEKNLTKYRNQKHNDDIIYQFTSREEAIVFTGKVGSLALVDTSNCYHYGSRPGTKARYLLFFQYVSPFAPVLPWRLYSSKSLPLRNLTSNVDDQLASAILEGK